MCAAFDIGKSKIAEACFVTQLNGFEFAPPDNLVERCSTDAYRLADLLDRIGQLRVYRRN